MKIEFKSLANLLFFATALSVALLGFFGALFNPLCLLFGMGGAILSIAAYRQQI